MLYTTQWIYLFSEEKRFIIIITLTIILLIILFISFLNDNKEDTKET